MASNPDQTQQQESQPAGAEDKDGFSAAFAERSADPAGQRGKAQEDGDKPSDQAPANPGAPEAPAEAATDANTSGTSAPAFDPWAELKPEQKSYFERLQASERSQRGRVGALTKKLNTIASTPAPSPAPTPAAETTSTGDEGGSPAESLDERLKKVTDEYGDVVGPIAEVLAEVRAEIASLKKPAATASDVDADAEALTEAYTALETAHPDYSAIAKDENFAAWLADQPEKVIGLANSYDPREVSLALTLFKTERSAAIASQPGEGGDQGKQGSAETDDRRRRQLEGNRQVAHKGAPAVAGVPDDFSAAFKARAQQHATAR